MKKRNASLDIFRIIAALLVILIHFSGNYFPQVAYVFGKIVVPIFMMITGYFFFRKVQRLGIGEETDRYIRATSIKILQLIIFWSILYIPLAITELHDKSLLVIVAYLLRSVWGINMFVGPAWYLISVLWGLNFVYYFMKHTKMVVPNIVGIIGLLVGIMTTYYGNWLNDFPSLAKGVEFVYPACSLLIGISWITLSFYLVKYKERLDYLARGWIIVLLFICGELELLLVRHYHLVFKDTYDVSFTAVVLAPLVFLWILNHNFNVGSQTLQLLKRLSALFYFTHLMVGDIIIHCLEQSSLQLTHLTEYLLIVLAVTIVSFVYLGLMKLTKWQLLNIGLGE
ncbi:acyltransferase [Weissella muntiaci]|uniref:Acyltransferase n=1 Tax=Weissella muntiaci TaxID=2508881 RepID=A0A6C2C9Y8_9LACO|nr:acyltransferase [Weissella muntiaci]TYC49865.1 acyltransferase [Weissella muntiaci]